MHALVFLQIEPMPAPRPRARAIKTRSGKSFVSMYNPADYMKWKEQVADLLRQKSLTTQFTQPVRVEVTFLCTQPKSTKLSAPKPDIDNYIKGILDAITDAGWWTDDTLVHQIDARKEWQGKGRDGCINLFIKEIVK